MTEPSIDQLANRLSEIEHEIGKLCVVHGFKVNEVTCALARMIGIAIRLNCATAAEREQCLASMIALTRQAMSTEIGVKPKWMN